MGSAYPWSATSFRPYDEDFGAGLADISLAFYACQVAFREVAEETEWRPAEGSPAEQDRALLQTHQPSHPPEAATLIIFLNYLYISAASEHLGALGAVYEKKQALIPPPALVCCVLEHCARRPVGAAGGEGASGGSPRARISGGLVQRCRAKEDHRTGARQRQRGLPRRCQRAEECSSAGGVRVRRTDQGWSWAGHPLQPADARARGLCGLDDAVSYDGARRRRPSRHLRLRLQSVPPDALPAHRDVAAG